MKKTVGALMVLSALMLGSCTTDSDYSAMANDLCGCMDQHTKDISPDMIALLERVANDPNADAETEFMQYAMDTTKVNASSDLALVSGLGTGTEMCAKELEKKYADKMTTDSQFVVMGKILKHLEKVDGCKVTVAMFKIGQREMQK
jgi:hypothetical protein